MINDYINKPAPAVDLQSSITLEDNGTFDFSIFDTKPLLDLTEKTEDKTKSSLANAFMGAAVSLPGYAKGEYAKQMVGTDVSIVPAMRYNDPEIGYTPFDKNLEDKYARNNKWSNLGKNLLGFGTKVIGGIAQGVATIPTIIMSFGQENKLDYILGDNPWANAIHDITKEIDDSLPIYRTNYENDHPVMKYFNIMDEASFLNTVGSTINNFGFTVGAISGALIESSIIGAVTGGAGFFPALAASVGKFATIAGRMGRLAAMTPKILRAGELVIGAGRTTNVGIDMVNDLKAFNQMKNALVAGNRINKITNGIKYQYGLISSARAEAIFEGAEVYDVTTKTLTEKQEKTLGRSLTAEEYGQIDHKAREAANMTVIGNTALLYISNKINWGSLFRPTNTFIKGTALTGWGKSVGKNTINRDITGSIIKYDVLKKTPSAVLGKVLMNSKRVGNVLSKGAVEGLEEGSQFTLSQGTTDYATKTFGAEDVVDVTQLMTSLMKGFDDTLNTNEGLENIMAGFVGGLFGGGVVNKVINGKATTASQQMQQQVDVLNKGQLSNLYYSEEQKNEYYKAMSDPTYRSSQGLLGKMEELVKQSGLAKQHAANIEKGDIKAAKDTRSDMAYNYWGSAHRNGVLEARKEELDAVRDLEGESFTAYWNMEYNEASVSKVNKFLDSQLAEADSIAKSIDIVDGAMKRNPYNKKTNPQDWKAFEMYKESAARSMYRADNATVRLKELQTSLKNKAPLMNLDKAIDMTSSAGMKKTSKEIASEIKNIQQQIDSIDTTAIEGISDLENQSLKSYLARRRDKLTNLKDRLDEVTSIDPSRIQSERFVATKYMDTMRDLWALRTGVTLSSNSYVNDSLSENITDVMDSMSRSNSMTDMELSESLEELQDLYQLGADRLNFQRMYNYLIQGRGETEFMKASREAMNKMLDNLSKMTNEDGTFNTEVKEEEEEIIRQEEYEGIDHPEEMTTEEREVIKNAAKKTAEEAKTEEELEIIAKFPEVFETYEKVETVIQEKLDKKKEENLEAITSAADILGGIMTASNANLRGVKTETLLTALFDNNTYIPGAKEAIHNIIFNEDPDNLNLTGVEDTSRIDAKTRSSFTNIRYTENPDSKSGGTKASGLYRKSSTKVIQIKNGNKVIGELRQPESIFYKDAEGKYQRVFSNDGTLLLTPAQYAAITFNNESTYNQFKKETEAYNKSYIQAQKIIKENKILTAEDISTLFDITADNGTFEANKVSQKESDAKSLLKKDIGVERLAILKLEFESDIEGNISSVSFKIEGDHNLTDEQLEELNKTIEKLDVQETLIKMGRNSKSKSAYYVAAIPFVGTKFKKNSFIRVRKIDDSKPVSKANMSASTPKGIYDNFSLRFKGINSEAVIKPTVASDIIFPPAVSTSPTGQVTYKGVKYTTEFASPIDRAFFALRNKNKNSPILYNFIATNMPSVGRAPMTTAQMDIISKQVVDKVYAQLEGKDNKNVVQINSMVHSVAEEAPTPTVATEIVMTNDMTRQPISVQNDIKEKASKDSKTFKMFEEALKKLGYKIVNVKSLADIKEVKSNEIYYVNGEHIGVATNPDRLSIDGISTFGELTSQKNNKGEGINVATMYDIFLILYTKPVVEATQEEVEEVTPTEIVTEETPDNIIVEDTNIDEAEESVTDTEEDSSADINEDFVQEDIVKEEVITIIQKLEIEQTPIHEYIVTIEKGRRIIRTDNIKIHFPSLYERIIKKYSNTAYDSEDMRNIIVALTSQKPAYKKGMDDLIASLKEAEQLLGELGQKSDFISKEDLLRKLDNGTLYSNQQKEIFKNIVERLKGNEFFNFTETGKGFSNFYQFFDNLLQAKNAESFAHEVGHWGFYNLLGSEDRIKFFEYVRERFYGTGIKPSDDLAIKGSTQFSDGSFLITNTEADFSEYFAEQFRQFIMSDLKPKAISSIFEELKKYLFEIIELFRNSGYNKDLKPFFDKIISDSSNSVEVTPEVSRANPIIINNRKDFETMLKSSEALFGKMTAAQVRDTATLVDLYMTTRAAKEGTTVQEQYNKVQYGGKELFNQMQKEQEASNEQTMFNQNEFPNIEQEITEAKGETKEDTSDRLPEIKCP